MILINVHDSTIEFYWTKCKNCCLRLICSNPMSFKITRWERWHMLPLLPWCTGTGNHLESAVACYARHFKCAAHFIQENEFHGFLPQLARSLQAMWKRHRRNFEVRIVNRTVEIIHFLAINLHKMYVSVYSFTRNGQIALFSYQPATSTVKRNPSVWLLRART